MTAHHRAPLRALLALATAGALGLALPAPASAHVTVRADDAAPGAWSKLTFRVPNESDTAGTVGLTVNVPTDTPFAFVGVKPHVGWDVEVTRESLDEPVEAGSYTLDEVVTAITWTAQGDTVGGGGGSEGSDAGHDADAAEPAATSSDPVEPQAATTSGGDDTAARVLAGIALVVGGAGLGLAVASVRRRRAGA
jgi:Domain of unkown function (DUF1775)